MKRIIVLIGFVGFVFSCAEPDCCSTLDYDQTNLLNNLSDSIFEPALKEFEHETAVLNTLVQDYIDSKSSADLLNAQNQWKVVALTWRKLEPLNIGEMKGSFLFNRIESWYPDTADVVSNLSETYVIDLAWVNTIPSNNIGMYVLEYFLFNSWSSPDQRYFDYLSAVTKDLKNQSANILNLWTSSYKSTFKSKKGLAIDATVSEILNYMPLVCEENLRDRISIPIGYYNYTTMDYMTLEAWRSRYSFELIQGSLNAIKNVYYGGEGEGFDDYLKSIGEGEINTDAASYFQEAQDNLDLLVKPLRGNLEANEQTLIDLRLSFKKIRALFSVEVIGAIGATGTFSDVDGDG